MKIFVKFNDDLFAVPHEGNEAKILDLTEDILTRIKTSSITGVNLENALLRMATNGASLNPNDKVQDLLEDGSYVVLGKKDEPYSALHGGTLPQQVSISSDKEEIELDGTTLTPAVLVKIGQGKCHLKVSNSAWEAVKKSRALLDQIVEENKVVYGVTTGFGKFARVVIKRDDLSDLQTNLIQSHAVGVGDPLTLNRTRMLFALRMNVLAKGYSGIAPGTLSQMVDMFNGSCLPLIPEQGTVGASGDLAPLAHLALGLIGEGRMWSPKTGWAHANDVLEANGFKPLSLGPKEGLALINGTQLISSLGAEALERATAIAKQADVVAALSLEVLKGTTKAFSAQIHAVRPHHGQGLVAKRLRSLLNSDVFPSEIAASHRMCDKVQDAYTLRCCPQVHGIVHDTLDFVRGILTTEINSATDNPMVFAETGETLSGGNFHGEYPAKALDYLAIGVHELANMSERRLERLVNPAYSDLPAFLTHNGGLNSGFMMAQVTAAALVSENKVLCHPSSVDSLTTSGGTEDHVSMGGFAARKALKVVHHVEQVIAIELLAACQGIDLLHPLKTTEPLQAVHDLVRSHVRYLDKDRYMKPDIDVVTKLLQEEKIWEVVDPYIKKYNKQFEAGNGSYKGVYSPTASSVDMEPPSKYFKMCK